MKVLSLGWGVQSFTLAAMCALGDIERANVALHADTTYERQDTYHFAEKYMPWLEERGVNVFTVIASPKPDPISYYKRIALPCYCYTKGMLNRECTNNWKRRPMRQWLRLNHNREMIELWLGISTDEAARMKSSDVKYITHRWPLVEKRMSRGACIQWLQSHGLDIPVKSACVFCPYHNAREWQDIRKSEDWSKVVEVDNAIRKAKPPYDLFLHPSRKPIKEVDLRTEEEKGQMRLWDEECTGLCGV